MAILLGKNITEEDVSNQAFYSAFIASAKSNITKIKISDLLKEPSNWRELKAYPKKAEFLSAYREELQEFDSKGTFEVVQEGTNLDREMNDISLLPLIWVFKYKGDSNKNLIKYRSQLVARGDLQTTEEDTYAAIAAIQSF